MITYKSSIYILLSFGNNNLRYFWNVLHYVLHPSRIFSKNLITYTFGLTSPILNILPKETHFRSYRGYTKCSHQEIILVTTHLITYNLIWIPFHDTVWERSILGNILKHCKITRGSCFDVIRFTTIVWPDKLITWSMTINNELKFFFILGNKISQSSWFRFREGWFSRPKISAKFSFILLIQWMPINTKVSIYINTSIFFPTHLIIRVHIFSLIEYFSFGQPMIFNDSSSINV